MYKQVEKPKENKSRAIANSVSQKKNKLNRDLGFVDNRKEILQQKALQMMNKSTLTHDGHNSQCNCIGCSGLKQLVTLKSNSKSNEIGNKEKALQLTRADIYVNNSHRGGHDVGQYDGAVGGVDHAEQRSWDNATDNIQSRFQADNINNVVVEFVVDQTICVACQNWFETTAFNFLSNLSNQNGNKQFELRVTVNNKTVVVRGHNETRWPDDVGDEERWPLVDQLKHMLITWGGLGENSIWTIRENGTKEEHQAWDLDGTIREMEDDIRESNDRYTEFLETGMFLTGDRRDIDFDQMEDESNDEYDREYRAAH